MTIPATLEELNAARQTAGDRYAAAIAEIEAAYIDLAAYDLALQNRNVNPGHTYDHRSFRGDLDLLPVEMVHPDFGSFTTDFRGRVKATADPIIDALSN